MPVTRRQAAKRTQTPSPDPSPTPQPLDPTPEPLAQDTPPRSVRGTPGTASPDTDTPSEEEQPPPKQVRNARKPNWRPWQDRALVKQALVHRPFLAARGGPIQDAWDRLAEELHHESGKTGTAIDRSGSACRARFKVLVDAQKKNEARALQLTGTDEEVNEHIMNLTDILALITDHETAREERSHTAKTRIATETAAALELRDAAMRGTVRRETLTDIAQLEGSTLRERQGQRERKRRERSPHVSVDSKENHPGGSDSTERPTKRPRRGANVLFDVLASRSTMDSKAMEQSRVRDEQRQSEMISRLDRMTEGIASLTDVMRQKIEQDKQQQMDMLKMVVDVLARK